MEISRYFDVVKRRWWIVAAVAVLTAILSVALFVLRPTTYSAEARFSVRLDPVPATTGEYSFDRYYLWFSSEFLVDDYTLIVPSQAFAQQVIAKMQQAGNWDAGMTPDAIVGSLTAERRHRVLTITVDSRDEDIALDILDALVAVLTEQSLSGSGTPSMNGVVIQDEGLFGLLDRSAFAVASSGRQLVNAAVAILVGAALGVALAFLLEFLDNRIRYEADLERLLGVPVIGAIPAPK